MAVTIRIGIIGDYDARPAQVATEAALQHAADAKGVALEASWLPTLGLGHHLDTLTGRFDGFWCAPGSPYQSLEGALAAIRTVREHALPLLGTCGGFQHLALEYALNVLNLSGATHAEYDPDAPDPLIRPLACSLVGKEETVLLEPRSKVGRVYGRVEMLEPFRCSYGLKREVLARMNEAGLRTVGVDREGEARVLELSGHDFYVGTLFVPQLASMEEHPHPLIVAFIEAALYRRRVVNETAELARQA
jgi:CTP synthase (UTP-ammonia lyase)